MPPRLTCVILVVTQDTHVTTTIDAQVCPIYFFDLVNKNQNLKGLS